MTGWFSDFAELTRESPDGEVPYGAGALRFAGSTFDPTSHYRGAEVFEFFDRHSLSVGFLREVSLHQVGLLAHTFRSLDLDPSVARLDESVAPEGRGGFLAIHAPEAARLQRALLLRGVRTDFRGEILRYGPAPYHSDVQLVDAMQALEEVVRG